MRPVVTLLLVAAVAIAGCTNAGPAAEPAPSQPGPSPTGTSDEFTPFDPKPTPSSPQSSGGPPLGPAAPGGGEARPAGFTIFDTGGDWGEPSIGVTESGAVFVTAATAILRSKDHGERWTDVSSSLQISTFDPYLWIDPVTDRVFHLNLLVGGSFLSYSDTDGDTWTQIPYAGGPGDHQKLASGPPRTSIPGSGVAYPRVLYYAVNNQQTMVSLSLDGGTSWGPEVPIAPPLLCGGGGINGQPHGTKGGAILVPYYQECAAAGSGDTYTTVYVAQSINGQTWARNEVARKHGGGVFDPDLASDVEGNVYLAYMGGAPGNYSLFLSRSHDEGATWKEPLRVPPGPLGTVLFPTIVAGALGELWISYLATDEVDVHPNAAPESTEWYLYASHLSGANTATPNITTYLVDPHPAHVGRVSTEGFTPQGQAGADDDRNLLEFIDSALDQATGRLWIAYTDGCPADRCTKKSQSNAQDVKVARLDWGPNILDPTGTVAPLASI